MIVCTYCRVGDRGIGAYKAWRLSQRMRHSLVDAKFATGHSMPLWGNPSYWASLGPTTTRYLSNATFLEIASPEQRLDSSLEFAHDDARASGLDCLTGLAVHTRTAVPLVRG